MKAGLVVSLCAALIGSASPVWSQTAGAQSQNGQSQNGQSQNGASLGALHQALRLSSQQEPAWQTYRARASAPNPAQGRRQAAAQMFPNLTAPQRLDLVAAEMKQELVDLDRQAQALKLFYAVLSPEQRAIFDAQTLPQAGSQQQDQ